MLKRLWPALVAWLVTRAYVLVSLRTTEYSVIGDVAYYASDLSQRAELGFGGVLDEYPVPAVLALWVPYVLLELLGWTDVYIGVIAALAAATDLAFFCFLLHSRRWHEHRSGRQPRTRLGMTAPEWVWVAAVPAMGALSYARFDLIPGIFIGLALLYVVHRPGVAGVFGALATGVKYVPAIVLPVLAAARSGRRRVLVSVAATGVLLAGVSALVGGVDRLFTPLQYQGDRGLQVESIAATPAMLAWAMGAPEPLQPGVGGAYETFYATYKAYEVEGPMVDTLLWVTTVATIVLVALLLTLWTLAWRRIGSGADRVEAVVWLTLASVGGFIVTSKVLSPQYLLWLLPAAAAGLVVLRAGPARRRLLVWSALLLVATALTHQIFPHWYGGIIQHRGLTAWVVGFLVVRNALLLALVAYSFLASARALRRAPRASTAPVEPSDRPDVAAA